MGSLFSVGVNFENLNGKLKEAQAEGQRWKRESELAVWEQQKRESVVMTQIHGFKEALVKSQAIATRQRQLRIDTKQMLSLNWRRIYQEILNLREHVYLQNQDHEVLIARVAQLEGEIQHLRDLSDAAQVIIQEQGD